MDARGGLGIRRNAQDKERHRAAFYWAGAMVCGFESQMTVSLSRDEILRRFEEFLDRTLAAEEPPQGVDRAILDALEGADEGDDSGGRCDSYSLWAAVTALTQEVR